jgi:hypothetical protein
MIYARPSPDEGIDQGDIVEGCPLLSVVNFDVDDWDKLETKHAPYRVVVLTQTCDLANQKTTRVTTAITFDVQQLVDRQLLKPADVKGPIRAGRVFGWYFLPKNAELGLPEMIVDLRQLHTVRLDLLTALCKSGRRKARIQPPYREHLAKHLADTYSRIGLPEPYETE